MAQDSAESSTVGTSSGSATKACWAEAEDEALLAAVKAWGTLWPCVAAQLPGRTPDAVRNRWHRLRQQQRMPVGGEAPFEPASPTGAADTPAEHAESRDGEAPPVVVVSSGRVSSPAAMHARACWSAHEDALILDGVRRFGCKWRVIAAQLPNRSDSSVRNRYVRLQTMARRAPEGLAGGEAAGGVEGDGCIAQRPAAVLSDLPGTLQLKREDDHAAVSLLVSFATQA